MTWNWQLKSWPQFIYNEADFKEQELQFFEKAGVLYGSFQHLDLEEQEAINIDLISQEAVKTSEIEGEIISHDSVQSSIRRQFGLQTDGRKVNPAEEGVAEMMVDLYRNYNAPLTTNVLCSWHEMLMNGRRDLKDIGTYRTHQDPMQIVSGDLDRPIVHFEAPPSGRVAKEMEGFLRWFQHTNRGREKELPTLIRSAIAHLYFECIHPFKDGNGRIGRAISEKVLSQGIGRPTLIALSLAIDDQKKSYYKALESNNKDVEITEWIAYFCDTILKAQDHTQNSISFIINKGKFYKRFNDQFNSRQLKVVERMFREGPGGFKGGLSAKNYQKTSGALSATATRDLTKLVEMGALKKKGELKSTRYYLNI